MVIEGMAGDWRIEIISDDSGNGACWMGMTLDAMNVTKGGDYRSIHEASSDLRCNIGYQDAAEFLENNKVPHDSAWWHLNHDNPWK